VVVWVILCGWHEELLVWSALHFRTLYPRHRCFEIEWFDLPDTLLWFLLEEKEGKNQLILVLLERDQARSCKLVNMCVGS
jgi:hypothetical protein